MKKKYKPWVDSKQGINLGLKKTELGHNQVESFVNKFVGSFALSNAEF